MLHNRNRQDKLPPHDDDGNPPQVASRRGIEGGCGDLRRFNGNWCGCFQTHGRRVAATFQTAKDDAHVRICYHLTNPD